MSSRNRANRSDDGDPNIIYGGPLPSDFNRGCNSLGEFILRQLSEDLQKVALISGFTALQITNGAILDQSLALASYLMDLGVIANDSVALISENRFEYPVTIFACLYLGARVTLLNPGYVERELEHALRLTKPKVIFAAASAYWASQKACARIRLAARTILFDKGARGLTFEKCLEDSNRQLQLGSFVPAAVNIAEHVAFIVMSSGTTGLPKGVQITHRNVMSRFCFGWSFLNQPTSLAVDVLPWFHVAGGIAMLNSVVNGTCLVFLSKFNPRVYLGCIQKYRPTLLSMVPPIAIFLVKNDLIRQYDLSSVKSIIVGAAPLSRNVEQLLKSSLQNVSICQVYGLSETTVGILSQTGSENKPGSVGRIRIGQWVKVIDPETGKTLGPNQRGELCFKGTLVMKGYLGTVGVLDQDRWFHTGDLGYYDDDKDFYIVDRLKELIKYKAFQVPPAELEAIILTHPKVKDAAVIGVPDERVGELATAYVVPGDGVELKPQEIVKYVDGQVSQQKRLHGGVILIQEIPKTASGKILRKKLREMSKTKSKL
ncbi:luciferin 4-monooxygenase-like [Uranotaenia lowii]|uniref:luciferin 4-monooxygenase-like n=1 Tax=Uranotaenia lowii TaxID=190385 RepID=UPI00247A0725|nr:luciferin 4-monooxygenase-like [Uranotaenia lowii]